MIIRSRNTLIRIGSLRHYSFEWFVVSEEHTHIVFVRITLHQLVIVNDISKYTIHKAPLAAIRCKVVE